MAQIMTLVPELQKGLTASVAQHLSAGLRVTPLTVRSGTWRPLNSTALYHRFWISRCRHRLSPQTVVIGEPEQMAASAKALFASGATLLKVKLDDRLISERMVAIRAAVPDATLIVDANESWRRAGRPLSAAGGSGVAMLEQPLPANDDAALENFIHPLPVCADESCHTRESLERA
jgi:L-alanine-DL-glutamate epimerase-like enolase superfamily enzyme